ncbi:ABC-F family ATP-binding cassette domain-containing protein [Kineococcus rhizosphaerae]|uniref:Macrolide transport system ATP-binding/permease protein n=1 Tax=Kineococcus rhizosphaerae TaxID=559628 RepID=A0A2T0QZ99_9ACTN|nr:ABC-F family ATP-binding cassette domain-containing protein [Kineococcus rhizosphaerae]PRY11776.1 macrolide transport system ATP-binding/permease protein [Kineococcus rhizosphaerae]
MPAPTLRTTTSLALRGVTKSYDHVPVLQDLTLTLAPGTVTGVIGENGCGKSTLLRVLTGVEPVEAGRVVATAPGGIGHLPQDAGAPSRTTVGTVLDDAFADLRALQTRMRELEGLMTGPDAGTVLDEYGDLQTAFELRGGYEADTRLEQSLTGLGLPRLDRDREVGTLSGGQRSRLHLAALLAARPEVLLLDEPTNHLDVSASRWLEDHLRSRSGTTVVVSHDREFLDAVARELVEVDTRHEHGIGRYPGSYADYLLAQAAERRRWEQARAGWEAEVERLRTSGDDRARAVNHDRPPRDKDKMQYGYKGGRVQESIAARVRANAEKLRRLQEAEVPAPPEPLRFTAPPGASGRRGSLHAEGISVAGRLAPLDLHLGPTDRLLVTGPNGAGKSTLLDVLAGDLSPDTGTVRRRGRVGLLRQDPAGVHLADGADRSVLATFAAGRPAGPEESARALLRMGLFDRDRLGVAVRTLSTGGRRRLDLARLLADRHDVLLLDEPTNHLAPRLVEELEAAIDAFAGAVVVVSHDRRFRRTFRGDVLELGGER